YAAGYHEWAMLALFASMWLSVAAVGMAGRVFLRILCSRTQWWGYPVVVIGSGAMGSTVVRTMKRWRELAFRPVVLLDSQLEVDEVGGVPVDRDRGLAQRLAREWNIPCAVMAISDLPNHRRQALLSRYAKFFDRLLVVPESSNSDFLWTTSVFFKGMLGYDVRWNYNKRVARFAKRVLDMIGAFVAVLALTPLWATIMVLILHPGDYLEPDWGGPHSRLRQMRVGGCSAIHPDCSLSDHSGPDRWIQARPRRSCSCRRRSALLRRDVPPSRRWRRCPRRTYARWRL